MARTTIEEAQRRRAAAVERVFKLLDNFEVRRVLLQSDLAIGHVANALNAITDQYNHTLAGLMSGSTDPGNYDLREISSLEQMLELQGVHL